MDKKIVLVEDDPELASLVQEYLESYSFQVFIINDGSHAIEEIITHAPDLVILDLMLPGKDGITICRELRSEITVPIMMLTASEDSVDQIVSLEIGADDYIKKPVDPRLLLARVRALLRRTEQSQSSSAIPSKKENIYIKDIEIRTQSRDVLLLGQVIQLSTPEYELLVYLAKNAGKIISREELFLEVKGYEYDGISRFIDITISQIRAKINDHQSETIKTVRGQGYLFSI